MPKAVALGLSIVCFFAAAVLVVAGYVWVGIPLFLASVIFDVFFVMALRAERRLSPPLLSPRARGE